MKCIPTLMFLPGLLFAFATRPIPSPVDSAGTPIILVDGAKMVDGTWVVSDEQEKLWFSQDKGAHWSTVPPEGAAEDGRVVGEQVVSQSDLKFWTAESGWKSMSFPVGFEDRPAYYIRPSGDRAFYNETSRIFKYYRSNDGLKTWTEWFALDSNNVPVGNFELFGQRAIGKIWFSVPDSSKLFGTTDGATWSQVNLPENFQVFVIMSDKNDSVLLLQGTSSSMFSRLQIAKSLDSGKTWSVYSATEPGVVVEKIAKDLYVSTTVSGGFGGAGSWYASAPEGPWTELEGFESRGFFEDGGVLHVITSTGILAIDPLSSSNSSGNATSARFGIRRVGDRLELRVPEASVGGMWEVVSIDGRILRSGVAASERSIVSLKMQGPAWIRFGGQVRAIPVR